jgi:hypothetical protein
MRCPLSLGAAAARWPPQGELPTYSFIEPQIIGWNHNDMHPPFGDVVATVGKALGADDTASLHFDPPSSLIGGEDLLARIYNAIRNSSSATGSNHLNTTLLVTFDEHGGTRRTGRRSPHGPFPRCTSPSRPSTHRSACSASRSCSRS